MFEKREVAVEKDREYDFRYVPKRKLSEAERQIITLKIEKVKLQREKTLVILNKASMLFFAFLAVGVIGLVNKIISIMQLNVMIIIGVAVMIVGMLPYSKIAKNEEKELEKTIDDLIN